MFLFLKYIQPVWYYRLACKSSAPLLADINLFDSGNFLVVPDYRYKSPLSVRMDSAYQGLMKGVIPANNDYIRQGDIQVIKSIEDNYRFTRKYYAFHWYVYVLLIRLITFNNPITEIWYFIKMLTVKKVDLYTGVLVDTIVNPLLNNIPLVTVVIPTLNRYEYLKDVLSDLEKQTYRNFEVLVCDQSDDFMEDFYKNWSLKLKVIQQSEKALWLARNNCIKEANGSVILLTEDDVRFNPDWMLMHLYCLEKYDADASCGIFFPVGQKPTLSQSYFKLSEQFATGNTLIKKSVFEKTGLFDRQFERQRMGDGEFGLRCVLAGFKLIQNPLAYCIDVKAPTGGLRQMGSWDALRPKNFFSPRPVPSVLYFIRSYFGNESAIFYILANVPSSFIPYKWRKNRLLKFISLLCIPVILPVMILSVSQSWREASRKLADGPKIQIY